MANWVADWLERSELSRFPVALRARHSIHVRRPNGECTAEFVGAPMHYRDSNGDWLPIDTTLRPDGRGWSAPGGRARVLADGTVLDRGTAYWQRAQAVGVVDGDGRFVHLATLPERGLADGENWVREVGPFRHVTRLHEDGVREVLHVDPAWGGAGGSRERLALRSTAGARPQGLHFGAPVTLAGERLAARRGLVVTPVGWVSGGVDPDFAANSDDGYIEGHNAVYATARSTSGSSDAVSNFYLLGQTNTPINYVYRAFVRFDTSSIPDTDVVSQANLKLVCASDVSTTDFDVQIVKAAWTSTLSANREANYDLALSADADAIWRNTSGMSVNTVYTSGNLSASYVSKTGYTAYALRSSRDAAGNEPTGNEYIYLDSQEIATAGYRPVLAVTHAAPKYRRALLGVGW